MKLTLFSELFSLLMRYYFSQSFFSSLKSTSFLLTQILTLNSYYHSYPYLIISLLTLEDSSNYYYSLLFISSFTSIFTSPFLSNYCELISFLQPHYYRCDYGFFDLIISVLLINHALFCSDLMATSSK